MLSKNHIGPLNADDPRSDVYRNAQVYIKNWWVCGVANDGVSMLPAFDGKPVERKVPIFWRTHVSPPNDRVALRIGDWKLVGDDTLTKFQL